MLFKIILQFLKQKVIEIAKFFIALLLGIFVIIGSFVGFIFGSGWIVFTIIDKFEIASFMIKAKATNIENIVNCGISVIMFIMLSFIIIALSYEMIRWIISNWREAKRKVQEKEFNKINKEKND